MAAAGIRPPSQALVRIRSGRLKTQSWASGHGQCTRKHVGSDLVEVQAKSARVRRSMAAAVKRSGGRFCVI